jgi:tetratricopeptide (TPR) repeat protein
MSKKKRERKLARGNQPKPAITPPLLDRRAMERATWEIGRLVNERQFGSFEEVQAFIQQLNAGGGLPASVKRTPLDRAQELMYDAYEALGSRRVELARQALQISEDCADAYVLLAEEAARSLEEARDLYEQGVKGGERALGSRGFEENAGHFWGVTETRPYMRARLGLAQCLWLLGGRQQAIEHAIDLLRLNPNDNQGVRYTLATWLLEEGQDEAFESLLKPYEGDIAAAWQYPRALWMFHREGASPNANAFLRTAIAGNRFVAAYLLGKKPLPRHVPEYVGLGDEAEAVSYAAEGIKAWQETAGALEWLTQQLSQRHARA